MKLENLAERLLHTLRSAFRISAPLQQDTRSVPKAPAPLMQPKYFDGVFLSKNLPAQLVATHMSYAAWVREELVKLPVRTQQLLSVYQRASAEMWTTPNHRIGHVIDDALAPVAAIERIVAAEQQDFTTKDVLLAVTNMDPKLYANMQACTRLFARLYHDQDGWIDLIKHTSGTPAIAKRAQPIDLSSFYNSWAHMFLQVDPSSRNPEQDALNHFKSLVANMLEPAAEARLSLEND